MMATGSFTFVTKTTGEMTSFNMGVPVSTVSSSKPGVTSSQAATTQPANPGRFGKGASGFAGQSAQSVANPQTGSASISTGGFGVANLNTGAKEKVGPIQSGQSSSAGGLHKSTTLSSLSQVTNPEPTAQAVSNEPAQSNEEENPANDTVDKSFAKSIQEEIQHFENELLELKSRAGRSEFQIGTKEDMGRLRKKTEEMGKFCEDIKKTVQEQNKDVQEQTTFCLDMFAMMEECRVRQQLNSDPKYKNLLKARALDSGSAEKLQQLRLQNQALDQGLRDVDLILETQWEDYQNRKKSHSRRVQAPTNDAIYRVVKSNLNLIGAQKKKLKDVEERLKQLKLYNKTSTWSNSGLSRHSNGDTSNVLSSLADSLVEQRSQAPKQQTSSENCSLRDDKLAQLREHLYRRHVPVVRSTKPENLSMSRLTIPDTVLVRSSAQSPHKPAVPQNVTGASGSGMEQIPTSSGAGVFTGQPMGAAIGIDKKKQAQTFVPDSKPTTTKKTASTTSGQKNGAVFTNAGLSSFTFSSQQATSSTGQFQFNAAPNAAPTFQGFGMGPSSKGSELTMPKLNEINGIKLEDVTPSGSDNEIVTTEEDEEYDEDSSESNGQGFGAQYSMIEQLKPDSQITSTPVTVKTLSRGVPTPKPGASNTPVSRKLFGQEDSQATSTFQFGEPTSQASGFGFGNFGPTSATPKLSTASSTSSATTSSSFSFSGLQSTGTKAPQSGFTFGAQQTGKSDPSVTTMTSQNSTNTDKGTAPGTGTGAVFSFGQKATGTDTKAFNFATTTTAPSVASSSARTSSTAGTATLATTLVSKESSVTGSDVISESTDRSTLPVSSVTASKFGTSLFDTSSASSASMSFGLQTSSVVSASKPAAPTTGGFGSTSSTVTSQSTITASSAGISTSVSGTLETSSAASIASQADKATSSATTGLFGKGTMSPTSSAAASSPLSQPCTETASKLGTLLSGTTSTSQTGTSTQATSTGIGQPESTSQPSAFSFGQSMTSSQPVTFGFGQSRTSTQAAPFSFGESAVTAQSITPQFGQVQTSTSGSSVSGLFGKPATATGGTLFGQTATTSSGGLFGQTSSSSGLFGTQSSSNAGPFGISSTGSSVSSCTGLFGAPATSSSGLFGEPATSSTGLFGAPASSSSGLFGAPATSSSGLFGTPATSSSGLFGSATSSSALSFGQSASFGKAAFGQSPGFGQSTGFGQTGSQVGSESLFGQRESEGSSGGLFSGLGGKPSAEKASSNVFGGGPFGSQAQSGSGLFGSNSSSTFGLSASTGSGAFSGGGGAFSGGGAGVGSTGFGATQQPSSGSAFGSSGFGGAPAFGGAPSFGSPPRFGSSPSVSGGGGFGGQPTFGSGSPLGGGTFGSVSSNPAGGFAGFASGGSPTFGALAKSADAPSFGSLNTSGAGGFGSPGFGGGQQSQPVFGGNAFGSSPQFTGYRG